MHPWICWSSWLPWFINSKSFGLFCSPCRYFGNRGIWCSTTGNSFCFGFLPRQEAQGWLCWAGKIFCSSENEHWKILLLSQIREVSETWDWCRDTSSSLSVSLLARVFVLPSDSQLWVDVADVARSTPWGKLSKTKGRLLEKSLSLSSDRCFYKMPIEPSRAFTLQGKLPHNVFSPLFHLRLHAAACIHGTAVFQHFLQHAWHCFWKDRASWINGRNFLSASCL